MKIAGIQEADLGARVDREGSVVTLVASGTVDQLSNTAFERALRTLHDDAVASPTTEAVVDLRAVEFMNSSGLKVLLSWISDIQGLEPPHRYAVRFLSNEQMHWQRRSLHVVRCFASDLITIDRA